MRATLVWYLCEAHTWHTLQPHQPPVQVDIVSVLKAKMQRIHRAVDLPKATNGSVEGLVWSNCGPNVTLSGYGALAAGNRQY